MGLVGGPRKSLERVIDTIGELLLGETITLLLFCISVAAAIGAAVTLLGVVGAW